jgi:hypothetical protein
VISAVFLKAEGAILAHEDIDAMVARGIVEGCDDSNSHRDSREMSNGCNEGEHGNAVKRACPSQASPLTYRTHNRFPPRAPNAQALATLFRQRLARASHFFWQIFQLRQSVLDRQN